MLPKGTEDQFDALRREMQRRYGSPIRTKTDCQSLEDRIFEVTGQLVSYNTLRRFFGLVPGGAPRLSVLDILSQFCGFPSFQAFGSDVNRFAFYYDWTRNVDKLHWTTSERDELLERVAKEDFNAQTMLLWVLYRVVGSAPISDWFFWMDHPIWSDGELSKAQMVFFSNSLADELRARLASEKSVRELHQNPKAFRWVTHFFADYHSIQGGYMAHVLHVMSERIEVPLYYRGMRIMQHFLAGTWNEILPHARAAVEVGYQPHDYPILIGRYFCARFWLHYLEYGTWDPKLSEDVAAEAARIPHMYHYLLCMEFVPIVAAMGFAAPAANVLTNKSLRFDVRSTWSASVDSDLIHLAFMLVAAQQGDPQTYRNHENQLQPDFWYKAYRSYLQALYCGAQALMGQPEPRFQHELLHYPGLARAFTRT